MEETEVFRSIIALLDSNVVEYETFEHEHVHHSADAAKIRGTSLEEAAKALVFETKSKRIIMCIVSGHRRIDLKLLKQLISEKDVHMATPEQVLQSTGCPIGSVPPFGNLFSIPVYADADVLSREYLVFSAGSHHHSIRMRAKDWERLVQPIVLDIGKDA